MGVRFVVELLRMKRHPPAGAIKRARRLRSDATDAENVMWRLLRESFPDARFRRQVPLRHFIADFASHRHRLVIEVDGGQHDEAADATRTNVIEAEGYSVLRFWNHDVLGNPDGVHTAIAGVLHDRHPLQSVAFELPRNSKIVSGGHDLATDPPSRGRLAQEDSEGEV